MLFGILWPVLIRKGVMGKENYLEEWMNGWIDVLTELEDVLLGLTSVVLLGTADSFDFYHGESCDDSLDLGIDLNF